MKRLFCFALLACTFLSCNSGKVFQRYEDLSYNKWPRGREVVFEVNIEDPEPNYNIILAVRHTSYYAFANIMVSVNSVFPSGEERNKEFDFLLRDPDGTFTGEGAGDIWDISFPLFNSFKFPEKGKYIFKINNVMPIPETQDIMQVGLIVTKA